MDQGFAWAALHDAKRQAKAPPATAIAGQIIAVAGGLIFGAIAGKSINSTASP
jgi:uncharacterized membrane protein YdjX (TVP38/TMEM64 family)